MIEIDNNLKYNEILENIEHLKSEYQDILCSFLWYDGWKKNKFMRDIKKQVYNLKFDNYKKDRIWEYLNDLEELETLLKIGRRKRT